MRKFLFRLACFLTLAVSSVSYAAQTSVVIANDTGANVRAAINNALAALVSNYSGTTAPAVTYAYMFWADTTSGYLKQRDAANATWISVFKLSNGAATGLTGTPDLPNGTTATTQAASDGSTKVATTAYVDTGLSTKQVALISGTSIKTINGTSILGSGDISTSGISTNGRLTLTSGTPVTTADVTAATTIYYTPYNGNKISTFNGSSWSTITFTEKSIAIPATTSTPFDVFMVDGTQVLETVNWTNDTTRATALVLQDGVLVKSGATTRRYLGTCRTTTVSGQTEDSLINRLVYNHYNKLLRPMRNGFSAARSTASVTYVELNTEIRVAFVNGYSLEMQAGAVGQAWASVSAAAPNTIAMSLGIDGTTNVDNVMMSEGVGTYYKQLALPPINKNDLAVGYHYVTLLGANPANNGDTITFIGSAANGQRCTIHGGTFQ